MRSAIIIPHYNQSGYLPEALASAIDQDALVVLVDDASDARHRRELQSLTRFNLRRNFAVLQHRTNCGLGAARNTGIRWALKHCPDLEFVLPLDSDDVLEPSTITRLESTFDAIGRTDIGWLYGDAILFGTFEAIAHAPRRFTRSRLLDENYCFATSFIHRRVFDAGIFYNESFRDGYEDWEFYIRASEAGYCGHHVGKFGFHYRKHGSSMLHGNRSRLKEIRGRIADIYPRLYAAHSRQAGDHYDLPTFAVHDVDLDVLEAMSSPDLEPTVIPFPSIDLDGYIPPIVIAARSAWLSDVKAARLWHHTLSYLQATLPSETYVALGWHAPNRDNMYGLDLRPSTGEVGGIAFNGLRAWIEPDRLADLFNGHRDDFSHDVVTGDSGGRERMVLFGPIGLPNSDRSRDPVLVSPRLATLCGPTVGDSSVTSPFDEVAPLDRDYVWHHRIANRSRTAIRSRARVGRDIGVVVPWIGLGGMDMIMLELARAYASNERNRVHLMTTDSSVIEMGPKYLGAFASINPVIAGRSAEQQVRTFMEEMDVLLLANSSVAFSLLTAVRSGGRTTRAIAFIQNIDIAADGVPVGHLFPLARQLSEQLDGYVVPSELTASLISGLGVPAFKVLTVPNAPIYPPHNESTLESRFAADSDRLPGSPLHLLFAGRFDRQKGMDRLRRIVDTLDRLGVPCELRLVGKAILESDQPPSGERVVVFEPTFDEEKMRSHFDWADCLLLPSRWEGLPLVMLDAMANGVLVITTDVGGIPEYVADGRECVLVADHMGDDHVVDRFVDALRRCSTDITQFGPTRLAARDFVASLDWDDIATRIECEFFPEGALT